MTVDASEILVEGPWRHRFVAANGARFHVAEAGSVADGESAQRPLVLLLHGFPQFWWAWRHQLPPLADAGYRVVAMDLRGYGASDKPPRGYDTMTLAADVAGVVRALGEQDAVVVGHDWGAWIAWSMPSLRPKVTRAVGVLSMGHPLTMRSEAVRGRQRQAFGRLAAFQAPMLPERRLEHGDDVRQILTQWSASSGPSSLAGPSSLTGLSSSVSSSVSSSSGDPVAGQRFPDAESLRRYRRAMQVPFVAHTSMEYYRWAVRSRWRRDGRRFAAGIDQPITVPVLQLHGGRDPWVLPTAAAASASWVTGKLTSEILPDAGHFLPEEAPDDVTARLLGWLDSLPAAD